MNQNTHKFGPESKPAKGLRFLQDDWAKFEAVNDPASGKKLPNTGHAAEDDWDKFEAVNDPASGKKLPNEGHAAEDDWDKFEAVNDPASGKKLPNEGHAAEDDWNKYEAVNDPASGKKLPNEGHAAEDDWDKYEAVNDPASGKKLPNEGHAAEDDWEPYEAVADPTSLQTYTNSGDHVSGDDWDLYDPENDGKESFLMSGPAIGKKLPFHGYSVEDDGDKYEAVNDPASGKKLPNTGHAMKIWKGQSAAPSNATEQKIFVTETFVKNVADIYGSFSSNDDEYPAMGITIQGSPIFVECLRFPDCAVTRRRATDEVRREHPAVGAIWQQKLQQYQGKCRTSTVHIHPMNFPSLSGTDIRSFESLRKNPDDPSPYPSSHPYPVILINLVANGKFDILGFWVMDGEAHKVEVKPISDKADMVREAWGNAQPMPFFSEEGNIARRINQIVAKGWEIELGVNPETGEKALKARRSDGKKVIIRFNSETPLGMSLGGVPSNGFCFEEYIDWTRMLNDLVKRAEKQTGLEEPVQAAQPGSSVPEKTGESVEIMQSAA